MKIQYLILILGVFAFASCETESKTSDKVASKDVYQKYEITYKEGGSVNASAEYRVEAY